MVEHDAAVSIDVDQRARLVERGAVERDAEFYRHHGEAFLEHRAFAVKGIDLGTPGVDIDRALEFADDAFDDVVLDRHAVGRHVVAADAVVVALPHDGHGNPEVACDGIDDCLDCKHALRPAIAAEGRVGHGVGLARQAAEADVGQPVAVVGVAQGPRDHGRRVVGDVAAVRR
ncbi:MAG TPA: hypothetical protein VNP96_05505 [Solirubrobacterales bacterium]|nr:hypothetical protein [Solirubrobacterales bacterium]